MPNDQLKATDGGSAGRADAGEGRAYDLRERAERFAEQTIRVAKSFRTASGERPT
jgi:hypothetical protein